MNKDEALDLALETLESIQAAFPCETVGKRITAIKQARALDKMADNARELGLDYESANGTQVSKVWWDGEKLMAKPIPLVDFYQPVQDSTCSETLRAQGKAYPRTCKKCGLGPCVGAPKQPPATQPAPDLQAELEATNCQVEILSDALAESRREVAQLKAQPAPVQEPVAWVLTAELDKRETTTRAHLWFSDPVNCMWTPVYTTPPAAQRQWVGLTDEDKLHIEIMGGKSDVMLAEMIEAKLKEKNIWPH